MYSERNTTFNKLRVQLYIIMVISLCDFSLCDFMKPIYLTFCQVWWTNNGQSTTFGPGCSCCSWQRWDVLGILTNYALTWLDFFTICTAPAIPASSFYSYGSGAGDSNLPANDDGSTSFTLSQDFVFFGDSYRQIYVCDSLLKALIIGICTW